MSCLSVIAGTVGSARKSSGLDFRAFLLAPTADPGHAREMSGPRPHG